MKRWTANICFLSCEFYVIRLRQDSSHPSFQTLEDNTLLKDRNTTIVPVVHRKMARWCTPEGCGVFLASRYTPAHLAHVDFPTGEGNTRNDAGTTHHKRYFVLSPSWTLFFRSTNSAVIRIGNKSAEFIWAMTPTWIPCVFATFSTYSWPYACKAWKCVSCKFLLPLPPKTETWAFVRL